MPRIRAAVCHAFGAPLTIEEIDLAEPIDREVLVRTAASGVCHSDLHFIEGLYPMPNRAILGHEAAGVVEAVGPNVTEVQPGDHVIACRKLAQQGRRHRRHPACLGAAGLCPFEQRDPFFQHRHCRVLQA